MTSNGWSIISNVFPGSLTYGDISHELDAFRVEGIGSGASKYRIAGDVIRKLEWDNKTSFASYSEKGKSYVVGFLNHTPAQDQFSVSTARAIYEGNMDLESGVSGYKTLTALLNKTKEAATKRVLWKGVFHTFFPTRGIDLTNDYGVPLMLFRGPNYRYNVLDDERIVLSLDVATRYVDSRPYLEHINSSGLDSLKQEIDEKRREMKRLRKSFRGIHFFYGLSPMDVAIDGIDMRPISEIPLDSPQRVANRECHTVAEFLIARYGSRKPADWLDLDQLGLRSGRFTFAPQFLHKNVTFQDVPSKVTSEQTYYTDDAPPRKRDLEHPARIRWEKTMDLFENYSFSTMSLGPYQLEFGPSLEFSSVNLIPLPSLVAGSGKVVSPSEIRRELRKGLFQQVPIQKVYLYSSGPNETAVSFYNAVVAHARKNLKFKLPKTPTFLERSPRNMEKQLRRSLTLDSSSSLVMAIVDKRNEGLHDDITNICGRLKVPSKCITTRMVDTVVNKGKEFPLAGYVSSLLTRAGCIPWVLKTHLSYDCYIATDVGRSKSENWVMMIVFDKSGKYRIGQTALTVGETVDRDSLAKCIEEVQELVPNAKSLLYLRDGSIYEHERNDFEQVVINSGLDHSAILAIRESTPFRIYRGNDSDIWRPHSGDYYRLDKSNIVLCAAGADEYSHGTPSAITIDFIPIHGSIDEYNAISDVLKLSYLNWASPGRSYSTPAPLRMAHRVARELSLGIERSTVPF